MSTLYNYNSLTNGEDNTNANIAREIDTGMPSDTRVDSPVETQVSQDVHGVHASDATVHSDTKVVQHGPQPPNIDGFISKHTANAEKAVLEAKFKAQEVANNAKTKVQRVANEASEDFRGAFVPDGLEVVNDEFRINKTVPAHSGVIDVGWNDPLPVADPLINDVPNGEDVSYVKVYKNPQFRGLDPIEAWENESSTDKLTLHLQRLYINVVLNMASLGKQVARLRSWREPRRTAAFCVAYFLAWTLDMLIPLVFATLIALVSSKQARDTLFPPVPRALVSLTSGQIQRAQAGILGTDDTLTGAAEKQKGEAVEEEAANFVDNVRHIFMRAVGVHENTEKEGDPLEGKVPEPIRRGLKTIKDEGTAAGHTTDTTKQTEKPMEEMIWHKANPDQIAKFMEKVPHVVGEVIDTWERFANALVPIPPFSRYSYLRIDAVLIPVLLVSLVVNYYMVYKATGFGVGFMIFGDPIISRSMALMNKKAPNWKESVVPKNNVLLGVPTNIQIALTLLRAGEAHKIPLPPVPSSKDKDLNRPVDVNLDEIPMDGNDTEKVDELRPLTSEISHKESIAKEEEPPRKHKRISKIMHIFKGNTKVVVETKLGVDQARAKLGSGKAKKHIGVIPKPKNMVFAGPDKFKARFEGKNGWVHITEGTQPRVVFTKDKGSDATSLEHADLMFDLPINEIVGLKRLSADLDKMTAKAADWSADKDLLGSVEIRDMHHNSRLLTEIYLKMNILTSNVFDPEKDIPNLSGKTFVVTGGSAGIGYGIVAHLLQHNADKIYLLSNKEEHADDAIEALAEYGNTSNVEWKKCNFEDFKQVQSVGEELSKLTKIDALVCNAGLGVGVYNESVADGIDTHMQVNVFAQNLLALMLLPVLLKTPNSRLVFQSSDMHRAAPSDTKFKSLEEINHDIGATYLYNRTKLAQILFARQLTKRLTAAGESSIHIIATHPGGVSTDQPKQAEEAYGILGTIGVAAARPFMKDPVKQGCRPALYAATSNEIVEKEITGVYIVPDKKVTDPSTQALDDELAENLWDLSETVLRSKLGELPYKSF
ncbi:hypothetical protein PVAG01_03430 [Phlyctema vagabunda]|uniref:Uncharacterized protein n=1 Tax=Phlyctema vagabunda TaxID=108571 RepID=A0ABR4PLE4_9HELO